MDEEIFRQKVLEIRQLDAENIQLREKIRKWQTVGKSGEPASLDTSLATDPSPSKNAHSQKSVSRTLGNRIEDENDDVVMGDISFADDANVTKEDVSTGQDVDLSVTELAAKEEALHRAEEETRELQKKFVHSQRRMEKTVQDLTIGIRLKESLIRQLVQNEKVYERNTQQAEQTLQEYEDKIRTLETEIEDTQKKVGEAESQGLEVNGEEKERLQKQIKQLTQEIKSLRKKQEIATSLSLTKLQQDADKRQKELVFEIQKMKSQQELLKRKMKEESDVYNDATVERDRELKQLRKEGDFAAKKIKQLESENAMQQRILTKKTEEMVAVQKKLKEKEDMEKLMTPQPKASRKTPGSSSKTPSTAVKKKAVTKGSVSKKKALEVQLDDVVRQKEAQDRLQRELDQREEILREKELALEQKSKLEFKKLRSSQVAKRELESLRQNILQVEEELVLSQRSGNSPSKQEPLKAKLAALSKEEQNRAVSKTFSAFLSPEDDAELREVEDRIEALEAEVEFKNVNIERMHAQQTGDKELRSHLTEMDVDDLKDAAAKYFELAVALKQKELQQARQGKQLQARIKELDEAVEYYEATLQSSKMDFDRKLTRQQELYEQKLQLVMSTAELKQGENSSTPAPSPSSLRLKDDQIQHLHKELLYYKTSCREMKSKAHEESKSRQALAAQLEQEAQNSRKLAVLNEGLLSDNQQLREFLRSKGMDFIPVRMQERQLRPLTAEDVSRRRQHSARGKRTSPLPNRENPSQEDTKTSPFPAAADASMADLAVVGKVIK